MSGEAGIQLDGDNVRCAGCQGSGDGAGSGTDFGDGAAAKIAQRRGNPLDGLRVVEEVLSELGFGGHGLLDGRRWGWQERCAEIPGRT